MEGVRDFNVHIPVVSEYVCKVSGNSLVGYIPKIRRERKGVKRVDELNEIFKICYDESVERELKGNEQVRYINERMKSLYKDRFGAKDLFELYEFDRDFTEYINGRLKRMLVAKLMRVERFKNKARLHCWNFFFTQTYDNKLFETEEAFKKAFLTCLSHLCTDYGWRVMGVFERGKKTGRLHFHGIVHVPTGKMKGFMKASRYFSPTEHIMKTSMINSFFAKRFGRNDFQDVTKQNGIEGISNYIVKYILKSDETVYYSRGIDDKITIELVKDDIVCGYKVPYGAKYLVFDEVFYGTSLDCRRRYIVS